MFFILVGLSQSGVPGSGPNNGAAIMKGLMTVKVVSQLYVWLSPSSSLNTRIRPSQKFDLVGTTHHTPTHTCTRNKLNTRT
jgi:hypothetical protein